MAIAEPEDAGFVRWPIRWRLPLLICGLLLATVVAFGWAGLWEVKRTAVVVSQERLGSVARQLTLLLQQSGQQRTDDARRLGADAAIQGLLAAPGPETRQAAQKVIDAAVAANAMSLGIEVWDGAGNRLIERLRASSAGGAPIPPARATAPETVGLSPMLAYGGTTIYYEVVAQAPAQGFIVMRRGISSSTTAESLGRLMGNTYYTFGTPERGVWTNLTRVTPAPPFKGQTDQVIEYDDPEHGPRLGMATRIKGTPWTVWVAIPRAIAYAAVNLYLARMVPLGFVVVLIGSVAAWFLAGRITRPLDQLTHAAEGIAAGDLLSRVTLRRHDELGRLGRAFNTMADRVGDGYHKLDVRVQERTAELEQALLTLKDTQEELVRREKLAMLGQLASGVGHELRNPLAVMTNAVYFLEMIQPDAPAQVHEYHGLLRAQIGLSEKIVSDLLDFARIKPPRRELVTLNRIVDDQLARVSLGDNIRVEKQIPADLPAANVDPIQMGQVVLNLLVNAVQAMEERGGVLILRGTLVGDGVRLDVIDNGPGVPRELQDKIFEALFTTKARGIGLGLAVSRSLVTANSGQLTLSSPAGEGATFMLTLPIDSRSQEAA
jgi:signal transduction histidine kinase